LKLEPRQTTDFSGRIVGRIGRIFADFEKFLEKKSSEFLGKDIIIKGRAKFSDYSNSYEISVYDFKYLNVDEELERAIKKIET